MECRSAGSSVDNSNRTRESENGINKSNTSSNCINYSAFNNFSVLLSVSLLFCRITPRKGLQVCRLSSSDRRWLISNQIVSRWKMFLIKNTCVNVAAVLLLLLFWSSAEKNFVDQNINHRERTRFRFFWKYALRLIFAWVDVDAREKFKTLISIANRKCSLNMLRLIVWCRKRDCCLLCVAYGTGSARSTLKIPFESLTRHSSPDAVKL